ncbi:ABC transporter substrate-binding protein [Oceaniradius stylonematis]|uniref:ABC transporter substrate-binding protein n=1 Tax=Oceaniradius stylonematis TaxID=2184161 RepID=UPI0035D0DF0B
MKHILKQSISGAAGMALLAVCGGAVGTASAEESLTIVSWGGVVSEAHRKSFWDPFTEESGIKILDNSFNGELSNIRAQVESGTILWDIAEPEFAEAALGCEEGLFEPLDTSIIDVDDIPAAHVTRCSVTSLLASTVLAYNAAEFEGEGPRSWVDFWDVDRFPGRRGLNFSVTDTLIVALLADGVAVDEVYEVLETKDGQDRAFAKLDELRDHIIWWRSGTEQIQGLLSGEYVMAAAWNGRVASAAKTEGADLAMAWEAGHILTGNQWVVLKGSKHKAAAMGFLAFALRPEQQADFMNGIDYGVISRKAHELISPERLAIMPGNPALEDDAVPPNANFWLNNFDTLNERFLAWASR